MTTFPYSFVTTTLWQCV